MNIAVLTIFPEMIASFLGYGIVRRAVESGLIAVHAVDIRDFAEGRHRVTDDRPYGGGSGMVMKPEPLEGAIDAVKSRMPSARTILLSPQGRKFDQFLARALSREEGLILVCGRYEGVDERIILDRVDEEISIGDYVLTGGELAAAAIIDALTRFIPGALGGEDSAERDSFEEGLLEHAHYTRPAVFRGEEVPEVLLNGNHREIDNWRLESSLVRTLLKRPDLLKKKVLSDREIGILKKWCRTIEDLISS
ncbi:MAG: tRNA (guanosine(37)-N1)-methyltransferase TrmD [Thermodesulfobacteriota bacterium]